MPSFLYYGRIVDSCRIDSFVDGCSCFYNLETMNSVSERTWLTQQSVIKLEFTGLTSANYSLSGWERNKIHIFPPLPLGPQYQKMRFFQSPCSNPFRTVAIATLLEQNARLTKLAIGVAWGRPGCWKTDEK